MAPTDCLTTPIVQRVRGSDPFAHATEATLTEIRDTASTEPQ